MASASTIQSTGLTELSPEQNIRGPYNFPPGRMLFELTQRRLDMDEKYFARFGDVYRYRTMGITMYAVRDPYWTQQVLVNQGRKFGKSVGYQRLKLIIGNGLLNSDGQFHRQQRRICQPSFLRKRLENYIPVIHNEAMQLANRWESGKKINIFEEMNQLTLTTAAQLLFGIDLLSEAEKIGASLTEITNLFLTRLFPFGKTYLKLPLPGSLKIRRAKAQLDEIVYRILSERRAENTQREDFLSHLMRAQDSENPGKRMTDLQLRDEVITMLLAGHETTANTMAFTWYLLAQHPEVEEKLQTELKAALSEGVPSPVQLESLDYTRNVFTESMRIYPPAYNVARKALEDCEIAGHTVRQGSVVMMSQFHSHRNEKYFSNPLSFEPQRWEPERKKDVPKYAYFPFGAGTRQCIGEDLAWMECLVFLGALSRRWRLELDPSTRFALQPSITLRPKYPILMTPQRRH